MAAEHQVMDPIVVHGITQFSNLFEEELEVTYLGVKGGTGTGRLENVAVEMEVRDLSKIFDPDTFLGDMHDKSTVHRGPCHVMRARIVSNKYKIKGTSGWIGGASMKLGGPASDHFGGNQRLDRWGQLGAGRANERSLGDRLLVRGS
ncbi:cysteine proteinase-like protein [Striga asiatica]|uniref:Cysteine proteinase-like protein n=1 Tax=Striga asiatica TaxID=4170 RepID=A0A5A7RLR2_STRAF|nr:cysteine proteinase-like protein [Striga asiatica]